MAREMEKPSRTMVNVLILYEDFDAGVSARRTFDGLAQALGEEWGLECCLWRMELLDDPRGQAVAAREASDADLLVVSSRGQSELSPTVKSWIEGWMLRRKEGPGALVGLFDDDREAAEHREVIRSYLRGLARRGRIDFFTRTVPTPDPEPSGALVQA